MKRNEIRRKFLVQYRFFLSLSLFRFVAEEDGDKRTRRKKKRARERKQRESNLIYGNTPKMCIFYYLFR